MIRFIRAAMRLLTASGEDWWAALTDAEDAVRAMADDTADPVDTMEYR